MVVQYLRNCPSEDLPISELGKKVVTLMALANAVVQLIKTHTQGPPKLVHYSFLSEDPEVCPATTLRIYLFKKSD